MCDFGLSAKKKNIITGTPFWLAPEYLRGQTQYTPACDIYSVGIVMYEIYSRRDPYQGEDFRGTLRKVCDRRVNKRPPVPDTCPLQMKELMTKCWSPDPFVHPEAKDLDTAFLDMSPLDAEPLIPGNGNQTPHVCERPTGDMLYQLFPKHIAEQLKAGQKVEPEQHNEVTVVFSNIVHFTDISRAISPLKVSNMLDRLYLAFDKVASKHDVFKVETIGDAYMGVTNLDKQQMSTHVKNAALFAIDLVHEASQILIDNEAPEKGYINIRVGFHSGPVVSNVIGSLNPQYGLFGDTVNSASRMESNSKANRILCSEASYKLLEEQAPTISSKSRGKIAVKGKGDMTVYWVGFEEVSRRRHKVDKTEIPSSLVVPAISSTPIKHVDFIVTDYEDDTDEDFKQSVVDEHLWRRDLKMQLQRIDSEEDPSFSIKKKERNVLEKLPPEGVPPKSHKTNVKEALYYSRGSNLV